LPATGAAAFADGTIGIIPATAAPTAAVPTSNERRESSVMTFLQLRDFFR
jgi:hypothetical protein